MRDNPLSAVVNIFNKLSLQQKIAIGVTVAITAVIFIVLFSILNQPTYTPLYSNLSQDDASKIVDQLTTQKVQYEITDNGKTISVPKDKVYEIRLSLASKGIPSSGVVGYEIFDKNTMGMSDFMQKLDYQRALEGELAKSIMEIDGVQGARVHIVIPQKSVFKDEQKPTTAAVVLQLRNNYSISKNNISAILNLVSSSVEGLSPGKVTLIDTQGKLLSKQDDDDPLAVASSKQYEIKRSIENYLAQKAQSMLDNVLGYGNSMVEINADLDFDQVEKTMESYDPNSQVAISEQTIKTDNNGKSMGDSSAQQTQNSTTNYEISKSIQKVIQGSGNIKRLSVAAVINDVPTEVKKGNDVQTVYKPRSQNDMFKLEDIIKSAVGVDSSRNDQISIVNIPFETKDLTMDKISKPGIFDDPQKLMNPIMMLAAFVAALFLLKGLMKKLKNEKIMIGTYSGGIGNSQFGVPELAGVKQTQQLGMNVKRNLLPIGDLEDEISDEAVRKRAQQDKISNYVSKNPVEAAKLINAWLHEDEFI